MIHTQDLTSPGMTGGIRDSTAGAWSQQVMFTLPGHIFMHFGFPVCP